MIKNYYYLAAGILAILFSVSHAWNGHISVLRTLNVETINAETRNTFFYVWHIITAENMLFGFAFIFMSFQKHLSQFKFAAWVIAVIILVRWIVIFSSTIIYNANGIGDILIDSIAIIVFVTIIILGTKVINSKNV